MRILTASAAIQSLVAPRRRQFIQAAHYDAARRRNQTRVAASRGQVEAGRVLLQSSKRVVAWSILETGWSVNSPGCPLSCCSSAPPAGAGRSSTSCDHLFWCRQPQRQFTDMFHYCQRFNRCRGKADSEIGKLCTLSPSAFDAEVGHKARPREPRQDCGSRAEPLADPIPRARSCTA